MRGIGVDGSASDGPAGFVPGDRAAAAGSAAAPSLALPMSSFRSPGPVFVVAITCSIAIIIVIATRLPSPFGGLITGASAIIIIGAAVRLQWGCAQPIARAGSPLTITITTSGCVGSNSGSSCSGIVGLVVLTRILLARSASTRSGRHVTCDACYVESEIGAD